MKPDDAQVTPKVEAALAGELPNRRRNRSPRPVVVSSGRLPMSPTVRTALCDIRDDLHALRRTVAARVQIETIQAIDALIGVAEAEAVRAIGRIDRDD